MSRRKEVSRNSRMRCNEESKVKCVKQNELECITVKRFVVRMVNRINKCNGEQK